MPVVLLAKATMKVQTLLKKFVCTEFEFHPDAASQPGGLVEGKGEGGVGVGGGGLAATTASSSSATPGIRGKDVPQSPAMMAMNDRRARMRQAVNETMATAKPEMKRKALMKLMDIEETMLLAEKQLEEDVLVKEIGLFNKEKVKGKARQKEKARRNSLTKHASVDSEEEDVKTYQDGDEVFQQGATSSFINFAAGH